MMLRHSAVVCLLAALAPFAHAAETEPQKGPEAQPTVTASEASPLPMLNVIYLVPNDMEPLPGHRERLGKILLEMRDFYNRELARNGSPARLRMPLDPQTGLVALDEVKGTHPLEGYPYEGGWKTALPDVEAHFKAHPERKRSDRTLIILPTRGKPGVPFYGFGTSCFALDYEGFDYKDCGKDTPEGQKFKPWYGGMAHELGHGLGLPHTHATKSQAKELGTALMGAGNRTLGFTPTFLTPGDCAFLESSPPCRVFEPRPLRKAEGFRPDIRREGGTVRVTGRLPEGATVRRVVAAYDKDDFGSVNDNYDAESFVVPFGTDGRLDFAFPMEEIHPGRTGKVQIQLRLIHDDGTVELIRHTLPEV